MEISILFKTTMRYGRSVFSYPLFTSGFSKTFRFSMAMTQSLKISRMKSKGSWLGSRRSPLDSFKRSPVFVLAQALSVRGAILIAGIGGWLSVSGWTGAIGGFLLMPFLWPYAKSRIQAAMIAFSFAAPLFWPAIAAAGVFFGETSGLGALEAGLIAWGAPAAAMVGLYAVGWSASPLKRIRNFIIIMALTALPPINIIGLGHPLNAAGILFPGMGTPGLIILLAFLMLAVARLLNGYFLLLLIALSIGANLQYTPPRLPPDWSPGVSLRIPPPRDAPDHYRHNLNLLSSISTILNKSYDYYLLPEAIAGKWIYAQDILDHLPGNKTFIIGAIVEDKDGRWLNALLDNKGTVHWKARYPAPLSMWHPWSSKDHFGADWFSDGTTEIMGRRIGAVICYEQLLPLPMFLTFSSKPDLVLATSNRWWSRHSGVGTVEDQHVHSWARLYHTPYVLSSNF